MDSDTQSLLALQGPVSMKVLQPFVSVDLSKLYFMDSAVATICGVSDCRINRCGYTGEDGFELSVPSKWAETVAESLVANDTVKLAGLGARDTLRFLSNYYSNATHAARTDGYIEILILCSISRLEAGMCLHGSDISDRTTPVEAALMWTISMSRAVSRSRSAIF